jgi:hypothetical protein
MKPDSLAKHLAAGLILAVVIYFAAFQLIENRRTRGGAWQVTFRIDPAGVPSLEMNQPQLRISNVRLVFPNEKAAPPAFQQTIVFDQPRTNLPFGRIIYLDTTFLPGAIVFGLFGHEIQLAPRVLSVDRREMDWQQVTVLSLPEKESAKPRLEEQRAKPADKSEGQR